MSLLADSGKFAPKNESGDTSTLKQRLLDKYKNPPKQTVEDFIKKEPNGKETRTYATSLAKKANELTRASNAEIEDMENTLLEIDALKEYSDKKFDYYFYQIDEEVGDNETPESWRYQKASDALGKAYSSLDEKYQEKDQARYDRLKRKMQERGIER
ncbi:hypothetical protein H6G77_33905 [Aulosira sp. FACHB-615]|nr:hypothetical protein [Aulosira sp. FACHB-615]